MVPGITQHLFPVCSVDHSCSLRVFYSGLGNGGGRGGGGGGVVGCWGWQRELGRPID